jgi:hypothetical protein
MTQTAHDTLAAVGGIDWAEANHDMCLQAAGTAKRECFQLAHTPAAIEAWGTTLRPRFRGQPVAVCLELTQGPLVHFHRSTCAIRDSMVRSSHEITYLCATVDR